MEGQMVAQADLIIATSEPLAAKFPAHKTKILPHGVDTKLFQTPVAAAPDMPIRKPIAGFYGTLANWIDEQMLAETAKALPEWQFVLIGKQETDVSDLEKLENVLLLGARPHLALPSYVQHWQVALLPFKDCPQITACNPLKLREYLSSGTPIASTDFPALAPYAPHVTVCKTGESFKNTLLTAAANNSPEQRALRQASVNGESWQQRAAQALQWLEAA
jgi:glycosyltransferase involved in cell wall biosynthesis